jgi:hypothetical protein
MWAVGLLFLDLLFGKYVFFDLPGAKNRAKSDYITYQELLTTIHLVKTFHTYYENTFRILEISSITNVEAYHL